MFIKKVKLIIQKQNRIILFPTWGNWIGSWREFTSLSKSLKKNETKIESIQSKKNNLEKRIIPWSTKTTFHSSNLFLSICKDLFT